MITYLSYSRACVLFYIEEDSRVQASSLDLYDSQIMSVELRNISKYNSSNDSIDFNTTTYKTIASEDDTLFLIINISIYTVLAATGCAATLSLFARRAGHRVEKRLKGIQSAETQIWLASLLFCTTYLPCMVATFLGADIAGLQTVCILLMWLYGTLHGAIMLCHGALAVCWMARILWPFLNTRLFQLGLYVILTLCWITPAIVIGIDVAINVGHFSEPSVVFCMNDLHFYSYMPVFLVPTSLISTICYAIAFITIRQWSKHLVELSVNMSAMVTVSNEEWNALSAGSSANFVFTTLFLIWKIFIYTIPEYMDYAPLALHTSFVIGPLIFAFCYENVLETLSRPILDLCRRERRQIVGTAIEPPSYADVMRFSEDCPPITTVVLPSLAQVNPAFEAEPVDEVTAPDNEGTRHAAIEHIPPPPLAYTGQSNNHADVNSGGEDLEIQSATNSPEFDYQIPTPPDISGLLMSDMRYTYPDLTSDIRPYNRTRPDQTETSSSNVFVSDGSGICIAFKEEETARCSNCQGQCPASTSMPTTVPVVVDKY